MDTVNNIPETPMGSRFHRYVSYANSLISNYHGGEPFHLYIKKYFATNKKHGSKDRKQITSLCYHYFRLGLGVNEDLTFEEEMLLAIFLCEKTSNPILGNMQPDWNEKIELPLPDKLALVKDSFQLENIFPFSEELSKQIDLEKFDLSFLVQPKLFIRIRPRRRNTIINKLQSASVSFKKIGEDCLAFSNNEKITELLSIDSEAVIQDYNSQRVSEFLTKHISQNDSTISIWDCCAASGGKSILASDILRNIELTVSDTRKNILKNLVERFAKAGIKNYTSFIADLSTPISKEQMGNKKFDLIIADVPCSGSGTWSRTPESIRFFSKKNLDYYFLLQQKIVANAIPFLKEGGHFLYITCSVFKNENEENVAFIQNDLGLELLENRYLKGYEKQADTLFAAIFKKK
jgi:16S rRNA (cytosine967-C5)-methyltransferase